MELSELQRRTAKHLHGWVTMREAHPDVKFPKRDWFADNQLVDPTVSFGGARWLAIDFDLVPVLLAFIESKGWRPRLERGATEWHCFLFGEQWAIDQWAIHVSAHASDLPAALAEAVCAAVEGQS